MFNLSLQANLVDKLI